MRVDTWGPRTWLIAGVAAWALLAWLLAVAGLGRQVETLADDPALLLALPQSAPAQPALGSPEQYSTIAERPLFANDRSPHPFFLEGGEKEGPEGFEYVLTSVLITPRLRMAIVRTPDGGEPLRVKLDESLPQAGWQLIEVTQRGAVFEGPRGRRTLELQVFDGTGGERTSAAVEGARGPEGGDAATAPASSSQPRQTQSRQSEQPAARAPERSPPTKNEPEADDSSSKTPDPAQAQMDSIRERIEARRAALRTDE